MLTREEKRQLKSQKREYRQAEKAHKAELKQQARQRKQELKNQKRLNSVRKSQNTSPHGRTQQKKVLSVFPIRRYLNGYFLTDDNQIIDLFQIQGRCYYDASEDEINNLVYNFARFLRMYPADFKFISMNYPTNTKLQQAFLTYKLQQPELEKFGDLIRDKLAILQELEKTTTDREAFLMIFAKNESHYEKLCRIIQQITCFSVKSIEREKKENIIFLLNNMNKSVRI
jgi:hypothetical protein